MINDNQEDPVAEERQPVVFIVERDEVSSSDDDDSDSEFDDIFVLASRSRKVVFEGVEMLKERVIDEGVFLKCTNCDHKLRLQKENAEGNKFRFMELKYHMQLVHGIRALK